MSENKAKVTKGVTQVEMPPGKYIVGDPCYSVPDDRWHEWLEAADYTSDSRILYAELDGVPIVGVSTAYGDGRYLGSDGQEYAVDAGLIGLVPYDFAKDCDDVQLKHIRTYQGPVTVRFSGRDNGVLHFGSLTINTEDGDED